MIWGSAETLSAGAGLFKADSEQFIPGMAALSPNRRTLNKIHVGQRGVANQIRRRQTSPLFPLSIRWRGGEGERTCARPCLTPLSSSPSDGEGARGRGQIGRTPQESP